MHVTKKKKKPKLNVKVSNITVISRGHITQNSFD